MSKILENTANKVSAITNALNTECFIVGGIVRYALLGEEKGDIDLSCNLSPQEMLDRLKEFRTIPTGLQHQTITVVNNDKEQNIKENIEITSVRDLGMTPQGGLVLG